MRSSICNFVSILCLVNGVCFSVAASARAQASSQANFQEREGDSVWIKRPKVSHYTESSYLSQSEDFVVNSKLTLDVLRLGQVTGYGGALLEQDSKSTRDQIYNDNGFSPTVGLRMPLFISQINLFTEYRNTFRVMNRPGSRAAVQPDFLIGSYGYDLWTLTQLSRTTHLFQEMYGDLISRSKLNMDPMLQSWSKTGGRLRLDRSFSLDAYLDLQFRRGSTGEREDNFQSFGPGFRFNYQASSLLAAVSLHRENGSFTNSPDFRSRWKTLLVISGAL